MGIFLNMHLFVFHAPTTLWDPELHQLLSNGSTARGNKMDFVMTSIPITDSVSARFWWGLWMEGNSCGWDSCLDYDYQIHHQELREMSSCRSEFTPTEPNVHYGAIHHPHQRLDSILKDDENRDYYLSIDVFVFKPNWLLIHDRSSLYVQYFL